MHYHYVGECHIYQYMYMPTRAARFIRIHFIHIPILRTYKLIYRLQWRAVDPEKNYFEIHNLLSLLFIMQFKNIGFMNFALRRLKFMQWKREMHLIYNWIRHSILYFIYLWYRTAYVSLEIAISILISCIRSVPRTHKLCSEKCWFTFFHPNPGVCRSNTTARMARVFRVAVCNSTPPNHQPRPLNPSAPDGNHHGVLRKKMGGT